MKKQETTTQKDISRKEALKKMGNYGKYAALTALGTYLILDPQKAQASSPGPVGPGGGFNRGGSRRSNRR
ncbi:MAG: hypothetical protein ACPGTO_04600 [Polaribacter sp.]